MKPAHRLHAFVMEQAEALPIDRCPQVYRDLSSIAGNAADARELQQLAADLETILERRRQIKARLQAA